MVAEHEGVENRSAQPRDYRSAKGGKGKRRRNKLGRRETPPPVPLFPSLGRLLDDFMPHKNDIKFVKTERRNDRTAPPYGVGDEGKAQEKSKSWKKEGERNGGVRNRSRSSGGVEWKRGESLTVVDMISARR